MALKHIRIYSAAGSTVTRQSNTDGSMSYMYYPDGGTGYALGRVAAADKISHMLTFDECTRTQLTGAQLVQLKNIIPKL